MIKFNSIEYINYLIIELDKISLSIFNQNPSIIKYIDKPNKEMCINAIKNDDRNICDIKFEVLSKEDYKEVYNESIKNNTFYMDVSTQFLENKEYYKEICLLNVKQVGALLRRVKPEYLNEEDYKNICLEALKHGNQYLSYVNPEYLSERDYKNICLEFIKKIDSDQYIYDSLINEIFIKINKSISNKDYYKEICLEHIKCNKKFLNNIDKSKLSKKDFNKIKNLIYKDNKV